MCDEYDDERMRVFWRALVEQKERVSSLEEIAAAPLDVAPILTAEPTTVRARTKPLSR